MNPKVWTAALTILLVGAVAILSVSLAPPVIVLYLLATFVIFMIPGIFLGPLLIGSGSGSWLERTIFGAVVGIALSSYATISVGFLFGWSLKLIGVAILALSGICAIAGRTFRERPLAPASGKWAPTEYLILAGMSLLVVGFCALPYLNVGGLTSHGYGYTWLFGIDMLRRSDHVSAMLMKMPPDNLWMTGIPLRMYLVVYAIPAIVYSLSRQTAPLHSLILLETLALSILMLGCLYIFLRKFISSQAAMLGVTFLAMVSYSYYWFYDLAKWIFTIPGHPVPFLSDPHFWYYDNVSHLFQRTFLVEPTAALATCLLLIMLSMLTEIRYKLTSVPLGVFLGICLGISFGTDAMQGLVMAAWFGLLYCGRILLMKDRWREEGIAFVGAMLACGLVVGSFFLMGMYKLTTSGLLTVKFNAWVFLFGLAFLPVEFGPLLILGAWGAIHWWRRHRAEFGWPLLFLAAVVMVQVAFLDQYPVPRTRIADRIWPIVLLIFAGYLFRSLWSARASKRARWIAACIILLGIPTFFADIYFASNIRDEYHTRYVRVEDQLACDWIHQNLPETAIVQGETDYFSGADHGHYIALIASFAHRPQVLGWLSEAVAPIPRGRPIGEGRLKDVLAMLDATDVSSVLDVVQKYSIDYVYVGPFEQERHKGLLPLLQSAPDQFREVYGADGVHIFQRLGNGVTRANLSQATLSTVQ